MNDFFDQQGDKLAYMLRTGKLKTKVPGFAIGGLATAGVGALDDQGNTVGNIVSKLWGGGSSDDSSGDTSIFEKATSGLGTSKKDYNPLGHNWANSAPFVAQHYTALGKFFTGAEPSIRNQEIERPIKGQEQKPAEKPTDFYARWYETMRRLAEAQEVVNRGQPTVHGV